LTSQKLKANYFVIPFITITTAIAGNIATSSGMDWYDTLQKPSWIPPGYLFGIVWTLIYILTTASALIVWNKSKPDVRTKTIMALYGVNAILNAAWSYLFFSEHLFWPSIIEMILLNITTIIIMVMAHRISKLANYLLAPYLVWVTFATYLAYSVMQLNT